MATKTISIKEEAYYILKSLQLPNESFSDTVMRLAKQFSNLEGSLGKGTMSDEEYEIEIESMIKSRELMFEGRE